MLRGAPRVTAPDGLKTSLLSSFEREATFERRVAPKRVSAWEWLAVPLSAAAAYAVVLIGGGLWSSSGNSAGEWVAIHPDAPRETPMVRVVDVDDASLDALGRAGSFLPAARLESP